ncbi:MAG TPA: hybrid sensor histidine kinase/response regulator [Burkholderiales bacterium]|jgi:signal transduction histidine kinase|nr:hybrid sensor histidine kinase/response regulator [Burkholderiales bacterium]
MNKPEDGERIKCLLVDDLEENLLALCALLKRDNLELITARSGPQALELLLAHDVALALIDVQMPEMDGFELAELMRGSERTRQIPLIFVTASGRDEQRMFRGYESGAVDYLYKPIEPRILINKAEVFFQLHRQKRQLARELQIRSETLRFNEMFVATLGHDLRSPLAAIVNYAELLDRLNDSAPAQQAAQRIIASGTRMSRMIDDLLDLARARLAGGIPLTREKADLGEIAGRVLDERFGAAPERVVRIERHGSLAGHWDGSRLGQAIANLVGNAQQHGAAGGEIVVALDGGDRAHVDIRVENSGEIPAELLAHIFDPFRRGSREAGPANGLGLGLYIVQQIVAAHRGKIEVQSDAGRTAFKVRLPR